MQWIKEYHRRMRSFKTATDYGFVNHQLPHRHVITIKSPLDYILDGPETVGLLVGHLKDREQILSPFGFRDRGYIIELLFSTVEDMMLARILLSDEYLIFIDEINHDELS